MRLDRLRFGQPWFVVAAFFAVFCFGTVHFCTAQRKGSTKPQIVVGVDGRYYWANLTSIFLDFDLDYGNQYADPESGNYYGYLKTDTGRWANPFPIGPAIAWAPFFAVAHPLARLTDQPNADKGSSVLEQQITLYASFLYAIGAMLLAYAAARRRFSPGASLAGALVAFLCGPLLHYSLSQPSYAHAVSAFFVSLLLFLWDGGRQRERTLRDWLLLGAVLGLAMLMRAQNLVYATPLVGSAVFAAWQVRSQGGAAMARRLLPPLAGAAVALVVFSPQMLVWKIVYGTWAGVPQGDHYMQWAQSLWPETLFASRNGLFPYAPLWAVAMLGWIALWRRDRVFVLVSLVCLALVAFINGATSDWSAGGAIGGRRFDSLFLPVALGFAVLVEHVLAYAERHPRRFAGLALAPLILVSWRCQYRLGEELRYERLAPSSSKDTLVMYRNVFERELRPLFKLGNPLSWPAAWAFAWRTGAPASRYDEVVGSHFLTDVDMESFRKRADKLRDELKLTSPAHERYLVHGWGGVDKQDRERRAALGPHQRLLVPMYQPDGARLTLVGVAGEATAVRARWNGREVARLPLVAGQPFNLDLELSAEQIDRGENLLDLEHEGARVGAPSAMYETMRLQQVPRPASSSQ